MNATFQDYERRLETGEVLDDAFLDRMVRDCPDELALLEQVEVEALINDVESGGPQQGLALIEAIQWAFWRADADKTSAPTWALAAQLMAHQQNHPGLDDAALAEILEREGERYEHGLDDARTLALVLRRRAAA